MESTRFAAERKTLLPRVQTGARGPQGVPMETPWGRGSENAKQLSLLSTWGRGVASAGHHPSPNTQLCDPRPRTQLCQSPPTARPRAKAAAPLRVAQLTFAPFRRRHGARGSGSDLPSSPGAPASRTHRTRAEATGLGAAPCALRLAPCWGP